MLWDPLYDKMDDLLNDWDLMDMMLSKGKYTWSRKILRERYIISRLGYFLCTLKFSLMTPTYYQE